MPAVSGGSTFKYQGDGGTSLQAQDITYDARGFVASRTDFNGHTTLYSERIYGLHPVCKGRNDDGL
jgi:hypothetical protein